MSRGRGTMKQCRQMVQPAGKSVFKILNVVRLPRSQGVSMFSHTHGNLFEFSSRRFVPSAGYLLVGIVVVILLIALFTNPALPAS